MKQKINANVTVVNSSYSAELLAVYKDANGLVVVSQISQSRFSWASRMSVQIPLSQEVETKADSELPVRHCVINKTNTNCFFGASATQLEEVKRLEDIKFNGDHECLYTAPKKPGLLSTQRLPAWQDLPSLQGLYTKRNAQIAGGVLALAAVAGVGLFAWSRFGRHAPQLGAAVPKLKK